MSNDALVDRVKTYFRRSDAGDFPAELFTADFEFYFPKYGRGKGAAEFFQMAGGLRRDLVKTIAHSIDQMLFIQQGNHVVAEGVTRGTAHDGSAWNGGETPGGRFCSVYAFNADGLIERMHIYTDPDYLGRNAADFRWPDRTAGPW